MGSWTKTKWEWSSQNLVACGVSLEAVSLSITFDKHPCMSCQLLVGMPTSLHLRIVPWSNKRLRLRGGGRFYYFRRAGALEPLGRWKIQDSRLSDPLLTIHRVCCYRIGSSSWCLGIVCMSFGLPYSSPWTTGVSSCLSAFIFRTGPSALARVFA